MDDIRIDEAPLKNAIEHASHLRDTYKGKDKEQFKFWKQEVFRLQSDLLRAQRINAAHDG